MLDDATALARAAEAAGVDVTLQVADGMIHVYQLYADDLAQGRAAIGEIGTFLQRHVG